MKINVNFKGIIADVIGDFIVKLKNCGHTFSIIRPSTKVHNLIMGETYIWPENEIICTCKETGDISNV